MDQKKKELHRRMPMQLSENELFAGEAYDFLDRRRPSLFRGDRSQAAARWCPIRDPGGPMMTIVRHCRRGRRPYRNPICRIGIDHHFVAREARRIIQSKGGFCHPNVTVNPSKLRVPNSGLMPRQHPDNRRHW